VVGAVVALLPLGVVVEPPGSVLATGAVPALLVTPPDGVPFGTTASRTIMVATPSATTTRPRRLVSDRRSKAAIVEPTRVDGANKDPALISCSASLRPTHERSRTTMEPSEVQRAVEAGRSVASASGLPVDEAAVVHNSNRIAVRLTPCDVLARVAPLAHQSADDDLEVAVARRLAEAGSPVAEPEPRAEPGVSVRDGFAVTLWTYYEPLASADIGPAEYANALARLHAGFRRIDVSAPHFTDRVMGALRVVVDRDRSPKLLDADRELLTNTLSRLGSAVSGRGTGDQLLHGEPHLGNLLRTRKGLLFIDLETCCRGPVEFDIAHGLLPSEDGRMLAAEEVLAHYPGVNQDVIEQCRILIWAMITTWRWQRGDQLPNGRYWAIEGLNQLRGALDRYGPDVSDAPA
jgi:hypothetical protein